MYSNSGSCRKWRLPLPVKGDDRCPIAVKMYTVEKKKSFG